MYHLKCKKKIRKCVKKFNTISRVNRMKMDYMKVNYCKDPKIMPLYFTIQWYPNGMIPMASDWWHKNHANNKRVKLLDTVYNVNKIKSILLSSKKKIHTLIYISWEISVSIWLHINFRFTLLNTTVKEGEYDSSKVLSL